MRTRFFLVPLLVAFTHGCADEPTTSPQSTEETGFVPDVDFGEAPVFDTGAADDSGDATVDSTLEPTDSTVPADSGGDTFVPPPDVAIDTPSVDGGAGAEVVTLGATNRFRILGTIVLESGPIVGEVLVKDDKIVCVAASCASEPDATGATVIDTKGIVFPGLIDAHNHTVYNVFDEDDWKAEKLYVDSNQWQAAASYDKFKKDKYNPMVASVASGGADLMCEMNKFAELKELVAGTTSVVGHVQERNCFQSLARTLGYNDSDFGGADDGVTTNTLGVGSITKTSFDAATAYVIHVAEGISATIYKEFETLKMGGYLQSKTVIVHGTALKEADFKEMATAGAKLVWSPRSNVVLYGTTTDIPAARAAGVQIALAPDWSLSGSVNILDELRFASTWDKSKWGGILSPKELAEMVTIKPAKILGIDKWVGSIAVGKYADLMVIGGDATKPYDALLAVTPRDVRMTMLGGKILYGDEALQKANPTMSCEGIPLCGRPKFVCVAEPKSTSVVKLEQTYADITTALSAYTITPDGGAAYKPAVPLPPLTTCPP